jgi:hypothetical protein
MAPERVVNKVICEKELVEEMKDRIEAYKKAVSLDKIANINNSEKSDVYSFGVMFWEMITQQWPYIDLVSSETYVDLFSIILEGKRPSLKGIDKELAEIIEKCWDPNPEKRPRFREVVVMLQRALISMELPTSACPDAAEFWIKHWSTETTSVRILDLVQQFANENCIPEDMKETVLVCLYGLLTGKVLDLPSDIGSYGVTLENFGKFIKWFGPLKRRGPLNMVALMQTPGFYGIREKTEADNLLLLNNVEKSYLIRLNTGASVPISTSPYVLSIFAPTKKAPNTCLHIRVYPRNNGWVCQAGEKVKGDSLIELIQNLKGQDYIRQPLEPSPYAPLWSPTAVPDGLYLGDTACFDTSSSDSSR